MRAVQTVRSAVISPAVVAAAVTTVTVTAAPTAVAAPCPDVQVVFARGTSEPAGIGRVGQAFTNALQGALPGRTVTTYGVNYPATYDFLAAADGALDATNHIVSMSQQCPSTRFVLGGYSQGAAVVDMLAGVPPLGNTVGSVGSAPPLPSSASGRVAAVAVFGNPATKFGNPVSAAGLFAGRAIDLCGDGDPICSDGRNPFAHTNYESSPFIGEAAGFAASLL